MPTNLLIAALLASHAIAISKFHGCPVPAWTIRLPPLLACVFSAALSGQHAPRNSLLAFLFMAQSMMLVRLAWKPHPGAAIPRERGRILLATGCGLLVLLFIARSASVLTLDDTQEAVGVHPDVQRLSYLFSLVVILLNTDGFLLMHKERAEALLREEASHDALTGILNRRALQEALSRELSMIDRIGRPLALVMIDIDHFRRMEALIKSLWRNEPNRASLWSGGYTRGRCPLVQCFRINDGFGHRVGDQVLCEVTRRIGQRLRTNDVLVRFGGEEFLLVLPATDSQGALTLAETVRHAFDHPVTHNDVPIHITVSAGIHAFTRAGARHGRQ